jgi:small subunit ribosomal protein S6
VRNYELMLVIDPTLDEEGLKAATERVQTFITGRGGEVTSLDPIGRRRMAYQIKHHRDGFYALARFKMGPNAADELERSLELNEQVIRHLLIRKD